MASPKNITDIADYFGETLLVYDTNGADQFNQFAFDVEKQILRGDGLTDFGLLGDQVYTALIADLDVNNEPQTAPYIDLVDGTTYTQTDGTTAIFCGLRKMLTFFVYSEYVKNNIIVQSTSGSIRMNPINSAMAIIKNTNHVAHKRWNKGVDLYNMEVYDYLLFYQSDFTNWEFTKASKFLTNGII